MDAELEEALREVDAIAPAAPAVAPARPPARPEIAAMWARALVDKVDPESRAMLLKAQLGGFRVTRVWLEANRYRIVEAIRELGDGRMAPWLCPMIPR